MRLEFIKSYYNEGKTDDGKTDDGKTDDGKTDDGKGKTFTQRDVDSIVSKERAIFKSQRETLVKQLEDYKTKYASGTTEREGLQKQIDELRSSYETESDRLKRIAKEEKDSYVKETTNLTKDRDNWKTRYTESRIARELTDAASAHDAISAEDIVLALRGSTELVPLTDDDGKPTGDYDVKVKFSVKDEEGKTKNLVLAPAEAVRRMKENTQRYGHYFKSGQSGGSGGSNNATGNSGRKNTLRPDMTEAEYAEWRKENAKELR